MQPIFFWITASSVAGFLLGAAAFWSWGRRRKTRKPLPNAWRLTSRPVFGADERELHRQLRLALPQHLVLAKLPLVRFCQPTDPREVRYWYDLLGASHVSFAVCSANGRVLAAIDVGSGRGSSGRSLRVKQAVLEVCRVPFVRYEPGELPSIPELQALVPALPVLQTQQAVPGFAAHPAGPDITATARRDTGRTRWDDFGVTPDPYFGSSDSGGVVVETPPPERRH